MPSRLALLAAAALSTFGQQTFTWQSVNIRGMGYVTGLIAHPAAPHELYLRTDVGDAYRFDRAAARWLPLMDRMADSAAFGVESIAGDPSDSNTVYAAAGSRAITPSGNGFYNEAIYAEVFVSHSRGAFWAPTGLAAHKLYIGANDAGRGTTGERLAVDPLRPSRLYFGTRKHGLWIRDGAADWVQAGGGLPTPNPATDPKGFGVAFVLPDASSSAAPNGAARRIYAGVYASGVWASDDGGVTWTNHQGGANPVRAAVAGDGTLFVAFGGDEGGEDKPGHVVHGGVKRYRGGIWTDITPPAGAGDTYSGISVSAADPRMVVAAASHDFRIYLSRDQGDTWTPVRVGTIEQEPGYYVKRQPGNYDTPAGSWGNAALLIDPVRPKRVWQTNGYGVVQTDDVTAEAPVWSWSMNNLEELVVKSLKAPPVTTVSGSGVPGADLLSAIADMVGLRHSSRDVVPTAGFITFPWVAQGTSIAYAAHGPENAAFVGWDQAAGGAVTGFTSDNGRTWAPFTARSLPGAGGVIAMSPSDPRNMVWVPSNQPPYYTVDGGASWRPCRFPTGVDAKSWQLSNLWWSSQVVAADAGGRFYYFLWNETLPQSRAGIFSSDDGGANWAPAGGIESLDPTIGYTVNTNIVPNPAQGGDVWIAIPRNGNQPRPFKLFRSMRQGGEFQPVPTVDGADYVAFGKGHSDGVPFVYIYGRAAGAAVDAIYKSEDLGATWVRVNDPGQQQFSDISALEGDMRVRDLVYVGTGGRGIFYGFGQGSGLAQPSVAAGGVVNAASFLWSGTVAPGEMVTVFGAGLGPDTLVLGGADEAGYLSAIAADTQVFFDGMPAPMIYSSDAQVTAVAPYWLEGRASTTMQVGYQGRMSPPVTLPVQPAAPGIFLALPERRAVAVNILADHSRVLNDAAHPAPKGAYLEFYVTGEGATNPPGIDGLPPGLEFPAPAAAVTVSIGGAESTPAECPYNWAGLIYAGVLQIDACVPAAAASGSAVPLEVRIGAWSVQTDATVSVQARE